MKTETPPVPTEAATSNATPTNDPGEVLAALLAGRPVPVEDPAVIAQAAAWEHEKIVVSRRKDAKCPNRASRFLRDTKVRWWEKNEKLAAYRELLATQSRRDGGATIIIYGPQGTGKTILAVDLINTATADRRHCRFSTAIEMLASMSDARHEGRMVEVTDYWASAVDVLVVDQFDKLTGADWENRLVFEVLDKRHNNERVTVLVANGTTDEIQKMLGTSMIQRIQEAGSALECNWPRYRTI